MITRVRRLASRGFPVFVGSFLLAALWLGFSFLPFESGLFLGFPFRVFFSLIVILGVAFFLLLRAGPMPMPTNRRGLARAVLVPLLGSVAALVILGLILPQYDVPASDDTVQESADAVAAGERFFSQTSVTCFLCHSVKGRGGTRGPDLTNIGTLAALRVPGLSSEEYLRQSILEPAAYVVPDYPPIMPAGLGNRLTSEEIDALVAYLSSLK